MTDSTLPLATESYRRHLDDIIRSEGLYALFDCVAEDYSVDPILSEISQNFIDVSGFVDFLQNSGAEMVLAEIARSGLLDGEAERRVIFAPCSPLVQKALDELARAFPEALFLDNSRFGQKIAGRTILAPSALAPEDGDICIILTRNSEAAASYERQFGKANCLNFLDIYPKALFATVGPEAERLVGEINARDKAILFASPRPMGTISSTIAQMQRDGYGTFWFGSEDVKADYQTGYSTPRTTDVALDGYAIGDLSDLLYIFTNMAQGVAVLHYEALFPTAWDFRRAAICYAATLALIRAVKECRPAGHRAKLGLYMYDAIKPGVKNYDCGGISGRLYKKMVCEAEALVFSSYTEDFGDFVENAICRPLPRVHCHRYQVVPDKRRPRLTDGFHIAIISVLLEEFWEPSRMGIVPYIRDIIAQGLHIHYMPASTPMSGCGNSSIRCRLGSATSFTCTNRSTTWWRCPTSSASIMSGGASSTCRSSTT